MTDYRERATEWLGEAHPKLIDAMEVGAGGPTALTDSLAALLEVVADERDAVWRERLEQLAGELEAEADAAAPRTIPFVTNPSLYKRREPLQLQLDVGQVSKLVDYLAGISADYVGTVHISHTVPKAWIEAKASIHVHANVRAKIADLGREPISRHLCWTFLRQQSVSPPYLDGLYSGRIPFDYPLDLLGLPKRLSKEHGSVFVDIRQPRDDIKGFLVGGILADLGSVVRLKALDECPCVPVVGKTIQGAELLAVLRRKFDFLNEVGFRRVDREAMGALRFFAFPKDELPNQVIEAGPVIREEIAEDERQPDGEFWDWANEHDMPFAVTPELYDMGVGVFLKPQSEFIIERPKVFICPPPQGHQALKAPD